MKLSVLLNSSNAIQNLLKQNLPIEIAWKIKTFVNKINIELKSYDEIRTEKIKVLGEDIGEGRFQVKKENEEVFLDEIKELQEKEIEGIPPVISFRELIEYSKKYNMPITISTNDLLLLDWLIVD
jgi:predicted ATPase